jgi:hypothetical protein
MLLFWSLQHLRRRSCGGVPGSNYADGVDHAYDDGHPFAMFAERNKNRH